MLPRRSLNAARIGALALVVVASILGYQTSAKAYVGYAPPVANNQIALHAVTKTTTSSGTRVVIYPPHTVATFTLVGITWTGAVDPSSKFQVKVRESGVWTKWTNVTWSNEHGADGSSNEASTSRNGTDPLLTAPADGVAVRVTNDSGHLPSGIALSLVNSDLTAQDRSLISTRTVDSAVPASVISPQGAIVNRPNIISRAQWGANESWRNQDPDVGTTIIAGFIHHTASTNDYSSSQGPAQMRNLYSYYTQSLKYKDLAYNFLVDKYGNVYEGRSGCPRVVTTPCDGPAVPATGAHTAGMNTNTFAISAIGNFQTKDPGTATFAIMDSAIAGLMAWKIAPYGLDPNAIANIPMGSDPKHLSRYQQGDVAHVLTISGHRDVGQTVCPGKYLYAQIPTIRSKIASLLTPVIAVPQIDKPIIAPTSLDPIQISSVISAGASWTINVVNAVDNTVLASSTGVQQATGTVSYSWTHVDANSQPLTVGSYLVSIQQSVTPPATPSTPHPAAVITRGSGQIIIALAPTLNAPTWKYRTTKTATISWPAATSSIAVTYKYRIQDQVTKKFTAWSTAPAGKYSVIVKKLKFKRKYVLQLVAKNAVGDSAVKQLTFVQKR